MAEGTDADVEVKEKPQPKKELSIAEKIDKAVGLKEEGNKGFKSGDIKEAVKKYNYALLYLKGLGEDPTSQLVPKLQPEILTKQQKEIRKKTMFACYSNLSACMLKDSRWERVVKHASLALELQPEGNGKTLYRRGTAYLAIGNLDGADSDLRQAAVLSPNDPAVILQLSELEKKMKEFRKKEKELYAGMFSRKSKGIIEKD